MTDHTQTTHLSDAELHDVVVVTHAINEAEALYLMQRLEDAAIPVLRTADAINYHNPIKTPEIRAPRTLAARAKEIIEAARQEAKARALENNFDVDKVSAMPESDPLLTDMSKLAELPHDQKLQELSLYVADWFAAGKSNDDIAQYLAAAGLTPDESRTLVADVYENQKVRAAHKQLSNARFGGLFALLGVVIFCTGMLATLSLPRLIGAMLFVYGITRLMSQPQNSIPTEAPKPADSEIKN